MADKDDNFRQGLPEYDDLSALEDGLQQEMKHRTGRRLDTLARKRLEMEALMDEVKAVEKTVEAQERDLAATQKENLDQVLRTAEHQRDHADKKFEGSTQNQMRQIDQLRQQLEHNFERLPPERAKAMREKLSQLMREALEKKQQVEREQRQAADTHRGELHKLRSITEETRLKLQKKHEKEIKETFSKIVDNAAEHQHKMKREFESLITQERASVFEMISRAKDRQRGLHHEHQDRQRDNKSFIKMQMKRCHMLIRKGREQEAYQIQKQLLEDLKTKFQSMQNEQYAITMDRQSEIIDLKRGSTKDMRKLQRENRRMFSEVRKLMTTQEQEFYDKAKTELMQQTQQDIENFQTKMIEKHHDMYQEQIDVVKNTQESIRRQAEDNFRRRQGEYENIVNQTKLQIGELEKRAKYTEDRILDEQARLFRAASTTLKALDHDAEQLYKAIKQQHAELLRQEQAETMALIKEVEGEKQNTEKINRAQVLEDQLAIGREAREKQEERDEEGRRENAEVMFEMIQVGKNILERIQKSKTELQDLTIYEKNRMSALNTKLEHRLAELQEKHLHAVEEAQKEYEATMRRVQEREDELKMEERRIQEVLEEAMNEPANMTQQQRTAFQKERDELVHLVKLAREKHKQVREEIEAMKREATRIVETRTEESRKLMKEKQTKIRAEYDQEVKRLHQEKEQRYQLLKKEQKILLHQHESHKMEMQEAVNSKMKTLQAEKRAIFEDSQRKLRELEKNLFSNQDGMGLSFLPEVPKTASS